MVAAAAGAMKDPTTTNPSHPLHQIAESATHRLLLKQWLKEEELIQQRISSKERVLDSAQKDIAHLHCFFFIFHSSFLILLFSNSSSDYCRRSWIPSVLSLVCSLAMIWATRYKMEVERQTERLLEREKEDGKLLAQCIQELKRKGLEFDLLKEVDALRRAKSLRVGETSKAVRRWSARDLVTLVFIAIACSVLGLVRVVLCNQA